MTKFQKLYAINTLRNLRYNLKLVNKHPEMFITNATLNENLHTVVQNTLTSLVNNTSLPKHFILPAITAKKCYPEYFI